MRVPEGPVHRLVGGRGQVVHGEHFVLPRKLGEFVAEVFALLGGYLGGLGSRLGIGLLVREGRNVQRVGS